MVRVGARRDFEAMEQRRLEVARLLKQGVWPAAVARRMGVTYSEVSRQVSAVERRLAEDRRWRVHLATLSDVKVYNSRLHLTDSESSPGLRR